MDRPMTAEVDTLPLERLLQLQERAMWRGRIYHPTMTLCGSLLTFKPALMHRVAEEAPVLTDPARLKAAKIKIPEWAHRTSYDWTLQVDMTWIHTMNDGLSLFMEFTLYGQGSLDQLLDPNPFLAEPRLSLLPPLWDVMTS